VNRLVEQGWVTHLATNGAGTIHDWELSFLGRTEESVRKNVATGSFGTWDETGRNIHLALLSGALRNEGYGRSLGRFIIEDGTILPAKKALEQMIREEPLHPLTPARAELLLTMTTHHLPEGRIETKHPWKQSSILAQAFQHNVPFTVHPGIGYDIIHEHPNCDGAAVGAASYRDFLIFANTVERLEGGVLLNFGSAIMGPEVYLKALAMARNVAGQQGRSIRKFTTAVFDLVQIRGDYRKELPKTDPGYYFRPQKTILVRTVADGGESFYFAGDHRATLPALWRLV